MGALALPPAFQDLGNVGPLMIRLADLALAAHPSGYGHGFSADAPFWPTLHGPGLA